MIQEFCKRGHEQARWRRGPYGKRGATYCETCRRTRRASRRKAYDANKKLKQRYGITTAIKNAMLAEQNGCCALCGRNEFGLRGPMVDHDHTTGRVRGILCGGCNRGLGWAEARPQALSKIEGYLRG